MKWGAALLFLAMWLPTVYGQDIQVYDNRDGNTTTADSTTNEDDTVAELEQEKAAQVEAINDTMDSATGRKKKAAEPAVAPNQELFDIQKELQSGRSSVDLITDPKLRAKLIKAYENNPMTLMPRELLKGTLQAQFQQHQLGKLFETFPKLLDFFVDFMRHPTAMAQMIRIMDRTGDLKTCGFVSLALLIVVIFLRRKMIDEDTGFFKKILISLGTSCLLLGGSLGFLYYNFSEELGPTIQIFSQTFLS